MKVQIRQGVFETNSSSTHAICVMNYTNVSLPKRIIFSLNGEYGWENYVYASIEDKASYLYLAITYVQQSDDLLKDVKYITECIDKIKTWLEEDNIDYEFDDLKISFFKWGNFIDRDGFIDHGTELYEFVTWILKSKEHLYAYLFDSGSCICTGNDNDDEKLQYPNGDDYQVFYKGN